MKNVTFVSALFDIDRVDGRKWDQYLKWFDVTLKLRVPMLLFITEDLQEFVDERRGDLPTKTVHITSEEIPYYHLKEPIQEILDLMIIKIIFQIHIVLSVNIQCIL